MKTLTKEEFNARLPRLSAIYRRYKDDGDKISLRCRIEMKRYLVSRYDSIPTAIGVVDREVDCKELELVLDHEDLLLVSSLHNNPHPAIFGHDKEEAKKFNIMSRAVHDWVHYENDYLPCTAYNEYRCFLKQSEGMPHIMKQIMFSEIVLQASYCEYNNGIFAPLTADGYQKVVLIDYERALTDDKISIHA